MEFFTWPILATMAGATAVTALVTQWLKGLFADIPTQIVSYIIALLVLVVANLATGVQGWSNYAILVINALVVSLGANGGYSAVTRITQR